MVHTTMVQSQSQTECQTGTQLSENHSKENTPSLTLKESAGMKEISQKEINNNRAVVTEITTALISTHMNNTGG